MRFLRSLLSTCAVVIGGVVLAIPAHAGWYTPTSGTTAMLYDVDYYSGYAVAVGASGTVRFSVDAGGSWGTSTSGTTSALYAVDMEGTDAIAVGYGGVILRSTNMGATWSAVTSGTTASLYDVALSPYGRAFAVGYGGVMLTSTDYGATWSAVTTGTTNTLQAVDIRATSRAYAVGSSGTILTWNGTTWSTLTSGTTETLYGVSIVSATEAWVVGSGGVVRKTTNTGTTWSSVTTITGQTLYSVSMSSATSGSIMAKTGIYETTDGTTWAVPATGSWSGVSWLLGVDYGSIRFGVGASGNIRRYDVAAPSVGTVTPTSAEVGVATTLTVTADDEASVIRCDIEVLGADGSGVVLDGIDSEDNTWTASYTPTAAGTYTATATCYDPAYNYTAGTSAALTVTSAEDITGPTVGQMDVSDGIVGVPLDMSVTAGADTASCEWIVLYGFGVEGFRTAVSAYASGDMTYNDGMWEASWTFADAADYRVYAYCYDEAGNGTAGDNAYFTVTAAEEEADVADTTAPTIGTPSPTSFTLGVSRSVTATVSDDVGIDSCELYIDAEDAGIMTVSGGTARKSYTFSTNDWSNGDTAIITVECADDAGNVESTSVTVTLSEAAVAEEEADDEQETDEEETEETLTNEDGLATEGELIKLSCADGAGVNDPCKAVYFYGSADGKRHAFPNEKVYFTWYENFDDVVVVSADFMSSLTLGGNVTYRPGARMVKFITVNTVYVVTRGGVLRPIDSEATATALYGSTWNQQIDDISDAFFGNYDFGSEVEDEEDYDAETEHDSVTSIDTDLEWR